MSRFDQLPSSRKESIEDDGLFCFVLTEFLIIVQLLIKISIWLLEVVHKLLKVVNEY